MNIVIATGGSGGHLFPALRVANLLTKKGHKIVFMGSLGVGIEKIKDAGYEYQELEARGLNTENIITAFVTSLSILKATVKALGILKKIKPYAVIGFGSYGAFPVVWAGYFRRVPAMIHEQNVVPGKANAVLSKFVSKVAITFRESEEYFPMNKTVFTGTPVYAGSRVTDKNLLLKEFGLQESLKTILVFGGSQGSQTINRVFVESLSLLKKKMDFQVIHLVGKDNMQGLEEQYNALNIPVALFSFFDNIERAYSAADLAVCRSGASTVMELAKFNLPAVLIPYPYAGGHQIRNASVLCNENAGTMIEEKDLNSEVLTRAVMNRLSHFEGYKNIYQENSEELITEEVLKLIAD